MRTRVSYLVEAEGPALEQATKVGDRIAISGLKAAKHVQLRHSEIVPQFASQSVTISWARERPAAISARQQPFDAPFELGTRVDASPQTDWNVLRTWLDRVLDLQISASPVDAESWLGWSDATMQPKWDLLFPETGFDFSGASAVKLQINSEGTKVEMWYPEQVWTENVRLVDEHTEVGILEVSGEPGHLVVRGRVRNLAQPKSEPIMFHTHPAFRVDTDSKIWAYLAEPYGLHPTLVLDVDASPPMEVCKIFAKLDLPDSVFMDKYQMADLAEVDPPANVLGVWGETDLEAPVWSVDKGSTGLIWLQKSRGRYLVPLHFRYQLPTLDLRVNGTLPAPTVFWACQDDSLKSHEVYGIATSFPPENTAFYALNTQPIPFSIPAVGPSHERFVDVATTITILVGSFAILWAILYRITCRETKLKQE